MDIQMKINDNIERKKFSWKNIFSNVSITVDQIKKPQLLYTITFQLKKLQLHNSWIHVRLFHISFISIIVYSFNKFSSIKKADWSI